MLKKIMFIFVVALLLIGAENLLAKKEGDRPKAKQQLKTQQKQKVQAKQKTAKKAAHRRAKPAQARLGQKQPAPRMFNKWFKALTKAYRQNDREKMGELLKKMKQVRQARKELQAPERAQREKAKGKFQAARRGDFHEMPRAGRRSMWQRGDDSGRPRFGVKQGGRFGRRQRGIGQGHWAGWQQGMSRGRRSGRFGQHRWNRPQRRFGW